MLLVKFNKYFIKNAVFELKIAIYYWGTKTYFLEFNHKSGMWK